MSTGDTLFSCHYKGRFELVNGITIYVGGEIHTLECKSQSLFTNLLAELQVSQHGQRFWYKLPFEDMTELKILCEGGLNFQKMCDASMWTKAIDIFMEQDNDDDNIEGFADVSQGDGNALHDVEIADDDGATFEEEARVKENVAAFVDDEENYDYHDTPVNSDCEDEQHVGRYETWIKGSGELKLRQVFDSITTFKEAVVEYVLKEGWNVKYTRWGPVTSEVRCSIGGGCPFRVYCSYEEPIGKFMIKTLDNEHTCIKDHSSKVLTGEFIAKMFLDDVRKDSAFKPRVMQDQVQDRYNLTVSHDICRKAKVRALQILQEEYNEQFARLKDYKQEILDSNPGSSAELGTVTVDGELDMFDRFYVCFKVLRETWLAHCRPIIGIDGCFLKCNVKGQLLAAVGRDANNQFYPVAWAVVQIENTDSWLWFIHKLKTDLKLGDGEGFTLISDRQKGLLNAVDQLLPKVEHRMCARHIYGNLRSKYPGKSRMKPLFWAVAESFNMADYHEAIEAMKIYDKGVYEAMMMKNPQNCSRAFFKTTSCCEDVHNNFSESYNNAIDKARAMPLVEMLETIRRQTMIRIDLRKKSSLRHRGKYSLKVANMIAEEKKALNFCHVIPAANGRFEVREKGCSYKVNISTKTCSCRRWDMTGIPCRHALKAIFAKKLDPEDYVSDWYLTSIWQNIYSDSIMPLNGMRFWRKTGEVRIQAPPMETSQGPKKKQKRIKGKHESPKKKVKVKGMESQKEKVKASKEGRTVHCGRCGLVGHNTRRCPNVGVAVRRPKKSATFHGVTESMKLAHGEGPSQPSQNSYD